VQSRALTDLPPLNNDDDMIGEIKAELSTITTPYAEWITHLFHAGFEQRAVITLQAIIAIAKENNQTLSQFLSLTQADLEQYYVLLLKYKYIAALVELLIAEQEGDEHNRLLLTHALLNFPWTLAEIEPVLDFFSSRASDLRVWAHALIHLLIFNPQNQAEFIQYVQHNLGMAIDINRLPLLQNKPLIHSMISLQLNLRKNNGFFNFLKRVNLFSLVTANNYITIIEQKNAVFLKELIAIDIKHFTHVMNAMSVKTEERLTHFLKPAFSIQNINAPEDPSLVSTVQVLIEQYPMYFDRMNCDPFVSPAHKAFHFNRKAIFLLFTQHSDDIASIVKLLWHTLVVAAKKKCIPDKARFFYAILQLKNLLMDSPDKVHP